VDAFLTGERKRVTSVFGELSADELFGIRIFEAKASKRKTRLARAGSSQVREVLDGVVVRYLDWSNSSENTGNVKISRQ
jgi:hypothetical protein